MNRRVRESADIEGGVVIGYDGSPSSERALRWAAQDCDRRGCHLHVLRAWTVPTATRPGSWSPSYVPGLPEFEAAVRDETERRVGELLSDLPHVEWSVHPVHGQVTKALIAASDRADLLVVGHSGGGGLVGLIVGSIGEQCVKHAHCPVVVVRADPADRSLKPEQAPADSRSASAADPALDQDVGAAADPAQNPAGTAPAKVATGPPDEPTRQDRRPSDA